MIFFDLADISETSLKEELSTLQYVNLIDRVIIHKWHTQMTKVVNKKYVFSTVTLIDSSTNVNFINKGIVPSKYFLKVT